MNYINYNGTVYPEGSLVVGSGNRGLRYGDGIFETIKMENARLVYGAAHFERMWNGLAVLGFEIPVHFTRQKLEEEIAALCKKNKCEASARVRLNIVRGVGGLYDAANNFPNYIIEAWPVSSETGKWNSNGLVTGIYNEVKKSCDVLSNLKHNNYLPYVMAALHAKREKWNDAILLNTANRVCDTTIANIFIIKDGVITTPSLSEGCVAGVMRKMLLEAIPGFGMKVNQEIISIEQVRSADEVFCTNSMFNIKWVQSIGDSKFKNETTREIYHAFYPTIF